VTRAGVDALLARLGALTVEARAELPCLEPGRADLIVAGTAIVLATMDLTGAMQMTVSDWGGCAREPAPAVRLSGRGRGSANRLFFAANRAKAPAP